MRLLAEPSVLGDFLDEEIEATDKRALAVLKIASSVVRAYAKQTWDTGDIPDGAESVTVDVAARVWSNPEGVESDAVDDVQRRFGNKAPERFYLTAANRMMLDPLKARTGGLFTISVASDASADGTLYFPTAPAPSGQGFPWFADDDPLVGP